MNNIARLAATAALLLLGGCVAAIPPQPSATVGGAPTGFTCYAGVYVCPVPTGMPVGTGCSCPGLGAPSFGTVN